MKIKNIIAALGKNWFKIAIIIILIWSCWIFKNKNFLDKIDTIELINTDFSEWCAYNPLNMQCMMSRR